MRIKEIIVVEGRDDTRRIQEAVEADTIETNGSAIDEEVLIRIEKAQALRGVIVLTDPDFPGGKIRATITERIPQVKHAFIRKEDCQSPQGGSLGVEHASVRVIQEALESVHTPNLSNRSSEAGQFCRELGLVGRPDSAKHRQLLGDALGIGHTNGKQFIKRIDMFQISQEDVVHAMEQLGLPVPLVNKKELLS